MGCELGSNAVAIAPKTARYGTVKERKVEIFTMTKLQKIGEFGQSIWLDFISRKAIQDGTLQRFIDDGVVGMTSNPAIFEKAMSGTDYDSDIVKLAKEGRTSLDIYDHLAVADVQAAADLLRPIFDRTNRLDGYVSLEVSPTLAQDTQGTIDAAIRYWKWVDRPNLMIKIPGTLEGLPAITAAIAEGINVNVTLLFAPSRYVQVIHAYFAGLEKLHAAGGDLSKVRSVASFFLSRIDSLVDGKLESIGTPEAKALEGKAAIASAKQAYLDYEAEYATERWKKLSAAGANIQRLLWASTSTKNPAYPDTLYVETLIGPETVNTLPTETIQAYLDHGDAADRLKDGISEVPGTFAKLKEVGIDMPQVALDLEADGLKKFVDPFEKLQNLLEKKRKDAQDGALTA